MKNLKKISREAAKQINGGAIRRCNEQIPCTVGWCCDGVCSPYICMIN
ncbi:bacteriocin-like protein [Chryseobacterium flavum]|nr:hypothetical protein [Chryseobacterium flavum]